MEDAAVLGRMSRRVSAASDRATAADAIMAKWRLPEAFFGWSRFLPKYRSAGPLV